MWGIWAERKPREGEFSLFVAWSSGAIVSSRFAMVAGFGFCLGSSTTNSRSLCCQHLGVGGRRHRAVEGINGHVILRSYLPSLGTCHTSGGWCVGMWRQRLLAFTSSRLWHICRRQRRGYRSRVICAVQCRVIIVEKVRHVVVYGFFVTSQ